MSDERGLTVVELIVAIMAGIIVLFGAFTVSQGTLRASGRVQQRVDATQRARPVLTHILEELHSSCIYPAVPPVQPGSTGSSIIFLHKTGSAVSVNPDQRVITLSGSTLTESLYPYASGSSPDWVFSSTPTTTRLLTNVGAGSIGGTTVPLFRYYAYDQTTAAINPTPLATPLSEDDADRTVQVDIAFSVAPTKTQVVESGTNVTVDDSVYFRFSPAGEDVSQAQMPCT